MEALLADLFPWVVAFWLVDGLAQLGRGHLLLVSRGGRFRVAGPGLHLLGLWPLDEAVAAFDLPLLAGAGAVWVPDPALREEPAVLGAEHLEPVPPEALADARREGRKVLAGGRVVARAPSTEAAEDVAAALRALAAPDGAAAPLGRLDVEAARARRRRQRAFLWALRVLAPLEAATVLLLWPLAAFAPAAAPLGAVAVLAAAGALAAAEAAVALAMGLRSGVPWKTALGGAAHLLLPWCAVHPLLHPSRAVYRGLDALAVAAALLPPEAFGGLAARELGRARFSRAAGPAAAAPAWDRRARDLEAALAQAGSSAAAALAPPPRQPGTAGYCPVCRVQYREGFERCGDCGVPVEAFGGNP